MSGRLAVQRTVVRVQSCLEVAMPEPEQTPSVHHPVVFRGGTVLTMDDAHTVRTDADVLVVGDKIAAVGPHLDAPPDALEVDARGGIVMPGMIDTHRHMWQTAMRGYGADWTLTQYFVWYYLEHGRVFRPEDIYAGNRVQVRVHPRRTRQHIRRRRPGELEPGLNRTSRGLAVH